MSGQWHTDWKTIVYRREITKQNEIEFDLEYSLNMVLRCNIIISILNECFKLNWTENRKNVFVCVRARALARAIAR